MPKEITHADSRPYGDESPARSVVELRWSGEASHVQLATRCIHVADHETFIPVHVKQAIEASGLAHTQMPTSEDDARELVWTCFDGFFIDLDRRGINKLIRDLRRARDQAFGRDE